MSGNTGFAQRSSGILVPTATLDKTQYTMPQSDFVKLKRLMAFAREFELTAMYFCQRCKEPVQLKQADRIVTEVPGPKETKVNASGGRFSLSCVCSQWVIR
jgi:hypothetical protein